MIKHHSYDVESPRTLARVEPVFKQKDNPVLLVSHTHMSINRADRQRQLEATARAALELRAGLALTDAEWAAVRARLVEFVGILRTWERTTADRRRGKVEGLCQREP